MVLALEVILTEFKLSLELGALGLIRPVGVDPAVHSGIAIGVIDAVIVLLAAHADILLAVDGPTAVAPFTRSTGVKILGQS